MMTFAAPEKRCRGNRYCDFAGPLHTAHLVSFGDGRSRIVGRCYAYGCGTYVCNRCAHRTPLSDRRDPRLAGVLEILRCPLDGEPLGHGDDWLIVDATGEIVRRCAGLPELDDSLVVELLSRQNASSLAKRDTCVELLITARDLLAKQDLEQALAICDRALALDQRHPLAWLTRRDCLEAVGRHGDAWQAVRTVLRLSTEPHAMAVLDLDRLESRCEREERATTTAERVLLRQREELRSLQRNHRASGLDVERSGVAPGCWTEWNTTGRVLPSPRAETRPRPVALLTAAPAETVLGILERLPPEHWYSEEWKTFLEQCERRAGIVFSGGIAGFLYEITERNADYRLLGSPIAAQLTVELRHDILRFPGNIGMGALYEEYVARCCTASLRLRGKPADRDEALALAETLARESFGSGEQAVDADVLARALDAATAGTAKAGAWRPAVDDAARACPAFHRDDKGRLGFSYGGFRDWFLARCVFASLFTADEPDFQLTGRRLLPDGAARAMEELAKPQLHRVRLSLQSWLSRNRLHASLFQGMDIPVLIRNLALIQHRVHGRTQGVDLSEADFSGLLLLLDAMDFTGAQLTGANFRGASLHGARFYDAVLVGATFAGAVLTDAHFARARTDLSDLPDLEDPGTA